MIAGERIEVTEGAPCPVDGTAQCLSQTGNNASVNQYLVSQSDTNAYKHAYIHTDIHIHTHLHSDTDSK